MTSRVPPPEMMCPYCAALPALPCNEAMQRYLIRYVHSDNVREWERLKREWLIEMLIVGFREFADSLVAA